MSLVKMGDSRALVAGPPYYSPAPPAGGNYVERLINTNADYLNAGATDQFLNYPMRRTAFTSSGEYLVVGQPGYVAGGGNHGRVLIFQLASGTYSQVATLASPAGTFNDFGSQVAISDDLTVVVGNGAGPEHWSHFLTTGTNTWSAGTDHSIPAGTVVTRIAISRDGTTVAVNCQATIEVYKWNGSTFGAVQSLSPSGTGSPSYYGVAIDGDANRIVGTVGGGSLKFGVDVWTTPDQITWSNVQFLQLGTIDGVGGSAVVAGFNDDCVMSLDGRVIVVGTGGVYRSGNFVGGLYVLQANGNVLGPSAYTGIDPYVQTALITGDTGNSSSFGMTLALSDDGQFLVAGAQNYSGGAADAGKCYGINRVQSYSGEMAVSATTNLQTFANPHAATADTRFGQSVGLKSNGAIVAVAGRDDAGHSGLSTLRVFANTLDDLLGLGGISNDDFANAITVSDAIVTNALLDPVKNIAASKEPAEDPSANLTRSLWWKITPSVNRTLAIDSLLSTVIDPFYNSFPWDMDTVIEVCTGSTVGGLTVIASNDDGGTGGQPDQYLSALTGVALTSGVTYHIRVYSLFSSSDPMVLRLRYSIS